MRISGCELRLIAASRRDKAVSLQHDVATDPSRRTSLPPLPASGLSSVLSLQSHLQRLLIQHGFGKQLLQAGVLFFQSLQTLNFRLFPTAKLFTPCVEGGIGERVFTVEFTGSALRFSLAKNGEY